MQVSYSPSGRAVEKSLAKYQEGLSKYQAGLSKYQVGLANYQTGSEKQQEGLDLISEAQTERTTALAKIAQGQNEINKLRQEKSLGEEMITNGRSIQVEALEGKRQAQVKIAQGQAKQIMAQSIKEEGRTIQTEGLAMKAQGRVMQAEGLTMKAQGRVMQAEGLAMKTQGQAIQMEANAIKERIQTNERIILAERERKCEIILKKLDISIKAINGKKKSLDLFLLTPEIKVISVNLDELIRKANCFKERVEPNDYLQSLVSDLVAFGNECEIVFDNIEKLKK